MTRVTVIYRMSLGQGKDSIMHGEPGGSVVRIRRGIVRRLVARVAIQRRSGEHASRMARHTGRRGMRARERESGGGVIEGGPGPRRRFVTRRAIGRESGRDVVGVNGPVEVRLVTGVAIG